MSVMFVHHRFTEKGNLEVLLFTIQSKMRANNQKVYTPREGKLISDINKVCVWKGLDKNTHIQDLKNLEDFEEICCCMSYNKLIC